MNSINECFYNIKDSAAKKSLDKSDFFLSHPRFFCHGGGLKVAKVREETKERYFWNCQLIRKHFSFIVVLKLQQPRAQILSLPIKLLNDREQS